MAGRRLPLKCPRPIRTKRNGTFREGGDHGSSTQSIQHRRALEENNQADVHSSRHVVLLRLRHPHVRQTAQQIIIPVLGFPLGFYMAAQGSLIVFVVMLFMFAKQQDKIDREFGMAEDD